MPNYTYRCSRGHVADLVRSVGVVEVSCATCGEPAPRLTVYRQAQWEPTRKLPGKDWREASDMLATRKAEFEKREGVEAPTPPLWEMAKAKANRLMSKGATSSADVR